MKRWSKKGRPRKLSDEDVAEIRRLRALARECTPAKLAARYGVHASWIQRITRPGFEHKQAWRGP